MTTHIVDENKKPLCGFLKLKPGNWPAGHSFVLLKAKSEADCRACLAAAKYLVLK